MNDKFKEIADRVGLGTRHNGIVLTKDVDAAEAFEQFAQSIVRECATLIDQDCHVSGAELKEHFGLL